MQNKNIMNLIGLQDIIVNKVEEFNNTKFIHIEMIKLIPVLYFMDKKVDILILKFRTALIVLKFQVR